METKTSNLKEDIFTVTRMIYGNWMQQVTFVFAELGVADVLIAKPMTIEVLASKLNVVAKHLNRVLRCASEMGYVDFDTELNSWVLTPRGELLGTDHPHSKRDEARLNGEDYRYLPWNNLIKIVRNGIREEYSPTIKDGSLNYLKGKTELLKVFHNTMTKKSQIENYDIIKDFDFSKFTNIMDLGCGEGTFLKSILDNNSHLNGVMFDIPETFNETIEEEYEGRLAKVTGDFFDVIPDNCDVYTMKNIIHNWREFKAKNLLHKVREAMESTSGIDTDPKDKRFLIVENVVPENGVDHIANWMDLNFMVIIDGAERTKDEYRILGEECGFKLIDTHATDTGRHIIEYSLL